jgi:hypothetical protein
MCTVIHFVVERFTLLHVNGRCSGAKDKELSSPMGFNTKVKAYVEHRQQRRCHRPSLLHTSIPTVKAGCRPSNRTFYTCPKPDVCMCKIVVDFVAS